MNSFEVQLSREASRRIPPKAILPSVMVLSLDVLDQLFPYAHDEQKDKNSSQDEHRQGDGPRDEN